MLGQDLWYNSVVYGSFTNLIRSIKTHRELYMGKRTEIINLKFLLVCRWHSCKNSTTYDITLQGLTFVFRQLDIGVTVVCDEEEKDEW